MVFYRSARIYIAFDCMVGGRIVPVQAGVFREVEFDPVEFASREEAYRIGGNLETWAETLARNIAEGEASAYCGEETFTSTNVDWEAREVEEYGEEIPEIVRSNLKEAEGQVRDSEENIESMKDEMSDLLAIPTAERTTEQRDRIRELASAIREEEEFIRDVNEMIERTKEEWDIE